MAERSTQKFARTNPNLSENNFPPGRIRNRPETLNYDELISALSQSYENRRAVQAFEWETVRRGHDVRVPN